MRMRTRVYAGAGGENRKKNECGNKGGRGGKTAEGIPEKVAGFRKVHGAKTGWKHSKANQII